MIQTRHASLPVDGEIARWTAQVPIDLVSAFAIFNHLPDVVFYVKDVECRWLTCNAAAAALLRTRSAASVAGKREEEFFPQLIAEAIYRDDRRVIDEGATIVDRLETVINQSGRPAWASTTKIPLRTTTGEICGLIGITRLIGDTEHLSLECDGLTAVVDHIEAHYATAISMVALARVASLSPAQLRARFKQRFHLSPMQFIGRVRLHAASHMLAHTARPIVDIASETGFCDQNYMTRQFSRYFGMSPKRYRRQHGRS